MKSSLHLLISRAAFGGLAGIYGQNVLLPMQAGLPPQFAAVVYAARDLHSGAPAAALIIQAVFSQPMMPRIVPGSPWWDDIILPRLSALLVQVRQHAENPRGPRLGGVAAGVASLVRQQSALLSGGGALLVPPGPPPSGHPLLPMSPPPGVPAFPVARRSSLSLAA
jgi:hypothetical protein